MTVGNPAHSMEELRFITDGLVLEHVPKPHGDPLHYLFVLLYPDRLRTANRLALVGHMHQDLVTMSDQFPDIYVALHNRIVAKRLVDNVPRLELGPVAIEPIGHENRDVVQPGVPGRRRQHNPSVVAGDLQEALAPFAVPY